MAHIHLPDGAFSIVWVITWFAASLALMGVLIWRYRRSGNVSISKLSTASILTALAFAIFQIEIPLFGGVHLNLTPLLGIFLGPVLGCSAALIVNIFSAALGHGGWSMIGANFLVNSVEVVVGYYLFIALSRLTKSRFAQAGTSTVLALTAGNLVMVGIILISGIQGSALASLEIAENLIPLVIINFALAAVEGIITAFAVDYAARMKPELLQVKPGGSV
ncbi:MAG TPA: energy-coupling factor ABC transporter permease [Acidobacteriota bacterium]|jgi:cobalt/nickel transport system permease protein|nr:energy-coupling factor ABC transporter permease [Acidobacteriota bacterium]